MTKAFEYRPDIDGLRAVAVTLVVIFHLFPAALPGGYLGVDVFFVISGYVITRRLIDERVNIGRFYKSRFWRLYPALLATIAGTILLGLLLFGPSHFMQLAESAIAAVFGAANIYFWQTSGYFETDSIYRPLLHLWTLGVEIQFYLTWPLLLILFPKKRAIWIGCVALVSFIAAVHFSGLGSAVFYNLPFRGFEFLVGSGLALLRERTIKSSMATLIGLALICGAALFLDSAHPSPGLVSLVPLAGAALAIYSGRSVVARRALAFPVVVYLGKLSYALYLVHWPIIVFWSYWRMGVLSPTDYVFITLLIFAAAALLHHGVEEPLRRPGITARRAITGSLPAIVAASTLVVLSGGIPGRIAAPPLPSQSGYDECSAPFCSYPYGSEKLDLIVLGDSHARHLFQGLKDLADEQGFAFGVFHFGLQCGPLTGIYDEVNYNCDERTRFFQDTVQRSRPTHMLIAVRWLNYDPSEFPAIIARLTRAVPSAAQRSAVVLNVPEFSSGLDPARCEVPNYLSHIEDCGFSRSRRIFETTDELDNNLAKHLAIGTMVMDPFEAFCSEEECMQVSAGQWLYSDQHHLSRPGSQLMIKHFAADIGEWLDSRSPSEF